jgi:hypothetical protein
MARTWFILVPDMVASRSLNGGQMQTSVEKDFDTKDGVGKAIDLSKHCF